MSCMFSSSQNKMLGWPQHQRNQLGGGGFCLCVWSSSPGKNLSLAWAGSGVSLRCCSLCDKRKHREGHVAEELLSAVREGMLDNRSGSSSQSEGLPFVGGGGGMGEEQNIWRYSKCSTCTLGRLHSVREEGVKFQWHDHQQKRYCCKQSKLLANYFEILIAHLISGCFCIRAVVVVISIMITL